MTRPREQEGGVDEASRLLQEGLELLDERTREVDALLQQAQERAAEITAEAERHAQEITAEAERQRLELEREVALLRAEAATLRGASNPSGAAESEAVEVGDDGDGPRWGRRSNAAAPQAVKKQGRRRWLPFLVLLLLLPLGGLLLANVWGQEESRPQSAVEPTVQTAGVTATSAVAPAAATAIPPTQPPPTQPPLSTPTVALAPTPTRSAALVAASVQPTVAPTTPPPPLALVAPTTAAVPPMIEPDGETSRDGPIVAVYTTFFTYSVQPGDTLNRLATRFGVPGANISRASGLADPNLLLVGQVLTIPRESGWLYRVQPDERLEQIAGKFGTSVDDLISSSALPSPSVRPGDLLFIPTNGAAEQKRP